MLNAFVPMIQKNVLEEKKNKLCVILQVLHYKFEITLLSISRGKLLLILLFVFMFVWMAGICSVTHNYNV